MRRIYRKRRLCSVGVLCDILQEKEIVRLLNLVHNPAYSHLEEPDYEATIPLLKEGIV